MRVLGVKMVGHVEGGESAGVSSGVLPQIFLILNEGCDLFFDAPQSEQVGADLGVVGAKASLFGFGNGNAKALGGINDFSVFFGGVGVDDDAADVVKKAGEKRALAGLLAKTLGAGDAPGGECDPEAVVPKFGGRRFLAGLAIIASESLEAEDEAADGLHTDKLDRFDSADDFVTEAELGGVDDLQKFGRDGHVLFDDFGDILDRDIGIVEKLFEFEEHFGRAREGAKAADQASNFGIGNDLAERAQAEQKRGESRDIARFGEIAVADKKAFGDFETVGVARNDNAGGVGLGTDDVGEELEAVHAGHGEVGDDDVEVVRVEEPDAGFAAVRSVDLILFVQYVREC